MKNLIKLLGIVALVAAIGFSVVGCEEDVLPVGNMGGLITATKVSEGVVQLSWNGPVEDEYSGPVDGYYVYRDFYGSNGIADNNEISTKKVRIATTSSTSYTDNDATVPAELTSKTGVTATYEVYPYNSAGEGSTYSYVIVAIKPW